MTITLFRPRLAPAPSRAALACALQEAQTPEFDENGRRYVFRYAPFAPQHYCINRERLFQYLRKLPGIDERRSVRDQRNTANFFEDIREIQTPADVRPIESVPPLRISAAS